MQSQGRNRAEGVTCKHTFCATSWNEHRLRGKFQGIFHGALESSMCPWVVLFTGDPGSVRFSYGLITGSRTERFERFSVPMVPLGKGVPLCFCTVEGESTAPVPVSVSDKTVPTVPFPVSFPGKMILCHSLISASKHSKKQNKQRNCLNMCGFLTRNTLL